MLASAAECPFCGAEVAGLAVRPQSAPAQKRMSRSAMVLLGASLALGACGGSAKPVDPVDTPAPEPGPPDDDGGPAAEYGGPAPDDDTPPDDDGGSVAEYGAPAPDDDSAAGDVAPTPTPDGGRTMAPMYGMPAPRP